MSVDPVPNRRLKVFAKQIFKRYEWATLKAFCQKYVITQTDLVTVFQKYLSHDEVYLREFRVRTVDPKTKFLQQTKLMQEIADVFIPAMYLVDFKGLELVASSEEVSFARFIITSYIFCLQQMPDFIFLFIAVLRSKLNLSLGAVMPYYSFQQLALLLFEDLQPCGAIDALKRCLAQVPQGAELRFKHIIRMGIKYPLLFYSLQRFRRIYQRFVFGDRFWASRRPLKIKHLAMADCKDDFNAFFANEKEARKRTARMLIADCIYAVAPALTLDDLFQEVPASLSAKDAAKVNTKLGYKIGKRVIQESELVLDFEPLFLRDFDRLGDDSLLSPRIQRSTPGGSLATAHTAEDSLDDSTAEGEEEDKAAAPPADAGQRPEEHPEGPDEHSELTHDIPSLADSQQHSSHRSTRSMHSMRSTRSATASADLSALPQQSSEEEEVVAAPEAQTEAEAEAEHSVSTHGNASIASKVSSLLRKSTANMQELVSGMLDAEAYLDEGSVLSRISKVLVGNEDEDYEEDEEGSGDSDEDGDEEDWQRPVRERPPGAIVVHDNKFNRDFAYDVFTGRSRWDRLVFDPSGRLFRQTF